VPTEKAAATVLTYWVRGQDGTCGWRP